MVTGYCEAAPSNSSVHTEEDPYCCREVSTSLLTYLLCIIGFRIRLGFNCSVVGLGVGIAAKVEHARG